MPFELKENDYLKLWMYFEGRADKVKEAMFKTLTWIIGFAAALLGFISHNLVEFDASKASVPLSRLVIVSAAAGLVICLYGWFMLSESGKHIARNWARAERCAAQVTGLEAIISGDGKKDHAIRIWNRLRIIVVLFAIAFTIVLIWASRA